MIDNEDSTCDPIDISYPSDLDISPSTSEPTDHLEASLTRDNVNSASPPEDDVDDSAFQFLSINTHSFNNGVLTCNVLYRSDYTDAVWDITFTYLYNENHI